MFRNNFRLAFRSLLKSKTYSLINIVGLSIGISVFILIFLFIAHETNFDQFHRNKNSIFRIQQDRLNQGELTEHTVAACIGAGPALKESLPEVTRFVRISKTAPILLYNGEGYKEEQACFASEDFFKMFTFNLKRGTDSLVLKNPYTAAVSESFAKKIFKNEDPVGKILSYRGSYDIEITGVYEDMPENSHMQFHLIISFATFERHAAHSILDYPWRYDGYHTYISLQDGADYKEVEKKFPKLIETNTGEWLHQTTQEMMWHLQPLTNIHLHSNFAEELEQNGSYKNILYLIVVALFIIITAWFNYISLATAKSLERAKEVGIRKVLGSYRLQLITQFLAESLFLNLAAAGFAVIITQLALPYFNELTGRPVSLSLLDARFWLLLVTIILSGSLSSGLYPAFVLSAFKPALILKGKFIGSSTGVFVRKGMVLIPFITAIILVSCLFIIYKQISFLRGQQLGFDIEQKLVIQDSEVYDSLYGLKLNSFKAELMRIPGIKTATYISVVPGEPIIYTANSVRRVKADVADVNQYKRVWVDENYIEVLGLTLLAGKNFTTESEPRKTILINELASKTLGFRKPEDAVNEKIIFMGDTASVVGVVNNFHQESPKDLMAPVIYGFRPDGGLYFLIPIETTSVQDVISKTQRLFADTFPGQPFNYFFLDERYNNQYKLDVQFEKVIGILSTLLLIVTGLGLFGLSAYTASVRTKEIGIRKVLGATEGRIIVMLCKEYLTLNFIAIVVAVPCAWYAMSLWLNSFASKIKIEIWMFLIPASFVVFITLLTISFQTIKAAVTNPIDTLKHE